MTTTQTTATKTVEATFTEIFNRAAFDAETPEAFQAEIASIWGMFSERPAVASEWVRFCAMKFSEVAA